MSYKTLEEIINRLPEPERKRAVVAIGDRTFTWEEALHEVKSNSPLAEEVQKRIEELRK